MKRSALLLFCLLVLAPAVLLADTVLEEIVARINNSIITRSEYQRSLEQLREEARQRDPANADKILAERQKDVLRDLIDQQLLVQKAEDLEITADNEVIKRLDEIRKNMKLESMEDLEKAAEQQGVSFEDFKLNLRNQILTQQVIGREVGSRIGSNITQEDVRTYYEQHKQDFEREDQVRLSEILVAAKPEGQAQGEEQTAEASPEVVAAAEAKARDLLAKIKAGEKFEEVARTQSDSPAASAAGDLGYFKRGVLSKELEDRVFAMKPGEVTDVIRTRQGFIVLKVNERIQPGIPPLKEIEGEIQNRIYMERLQPALRQYLTKLREEAYVDVKEGFVDTGASPNQTKLVVSAAPADEQPKKKKKRFLLF